jgi:hypothetical protein
MGFLEPTSTPYAFTPELGPPPAIASFSWLRPVAFKKVARLRAAQPWKTAA